MEYKNRVGQFDEIVRCFKVLVDGVNVEELFLNSVAQQGESILKHQDGIEECRRLKTKLDLANKDMNVVVEKLGSARRWLDAERQKRKRVEREREDLARHLDQVRRILLNDPRHIKLSDEARAKLAFLNRGSSDSSLDDTNGRPPQLNTLAESDSFSDMSYSRSVDDLDTDMPMRPHSNKRNRSIFVGEELAAKKRKPSMDGAIISSPPAPPPYTASQPDVIKTPLSVGTKKVFVSPNTNTIPVSAVHRINMRCHNFVTKTFIMPEACSWCSKKIGFGRSVLKCLDCQIIAHSDCNEKMTLPCVPSGTSPKKGGATGLISDYTPSTPPMVPAVVVHCAVEVERRGLKEQGIYRESGSEATVRGLREKFLKGRGVPCLTDVDIHSVCCFLKSFLRNLQDPLIPQHKRNAFIAAIASRDNKAMELVKLVQTLPQANRDTLAYLVLHLQNVAKSPECKMAVPNLSKVFGPTVVGYSSDLSSAETDVYHSNAIMEELLLLPSSYWNDLLSSREPKTPLMATTSEAKTPLFGEPFAKTPRRLMSGTTPGTRRKFFRSSPPLQA